MKDKTVEELIKYICDDCIAVDSPEFPNELLRRFEAMKCCGNCKLYLECFQSCYYRICDNWQSDGLSREEREGK